MTDSNVVTTNELERLDQANALVASYSKYAAGAGLIPVPIVDTAAVLAVQLRMLSQLAGLYDLKFSDSRNKAILGSLLGSIFSVNAGSGTAQVLGSGLKSLPVIGTFFGAVTVAGFAGAATYAVGKVFIQHFESGGTFLDFNPEEVREYFYNQFKKSQETSAPSSTKAASSGKPATAT
jgi:uncharacterized protein (DUF697 family)